MVLTVNDLHKVSVSNILTHALVYSQVEVKAPWFFRTSDEVVEDGTYLGSVAYEGAEPPPRFYVVEPSGRVWTYVRQKTVRKGIFGRVFSLLQAALTRWRHKGLEKTSGEGLASA